MVTRAHPIPNSYWATPHLVACEYPWDPKHPSDPKLDALLKAGCRTFVDLTECDELRPYASQLLVRAVLLNIDEKEIEYHRFPIHDRSLPQSVEFLYPVMDVLRDNAARDRITAVHCRGGIGRTGLVVGCWLVESGLARNGEEALKIIDREWHGVAKFTVYPHSPETGPQCDFVLNFQPKHVDDIVGKRPRL
ncbi:protein-tyrosine phosphatase-like protein [Mycena maculata]|uniref:Protein-tyrosine phosphatase-like protein n=1 Tax=Mycena maculata TaxID=230809 RepID=A0AAD7J4R4_9AGAR|nr:protein-tyrosine phosphatase-like protein [Mycena maculata]